MEWTLLFLSWCVVSHPLADRIFDRSAQVVAHPRFVEVIYEVALSDVTLTSELNEFMDEQSIAGKPSSRVLQYAEVMAPIIGRGMILSVGESEYSLDPVDLKMPTVQDHVQLRIFYRADVELTGRPGLTLIDTNFAGERGFHRIALDATGGVQIAESSAARQLSDVERIPVWQMTPEQERAGSHVAATLVVEESIEKQSKDQVVKEPLTHAPAKTQAQPQDRRESRWLTGVPIAVLIITLIGVLKRSADRRKHG